MKKLSLILAASAFAAVPAMADDVGGTVMPSCTMTGGGVNVTFANMDANGQGDDFDVTGIDVFCNLPSTINFESLNGYLLNTDADAAGDGPTGQTNLESATIAGFNAAVDYRFQFDSVFIAGTPIPVLWDTTLMNPATPVSIPVDPVNVTGATITYGTVANGNGLPALAGAYEDDIVVTITSTGF